MSVYDESLLWATNNFGELSELEGVKYSVDELSNIASEALSDWNGIKSKKWLFVFSSHSTIPLYELADDALRMIFAHAKFATVADHGGMLFGADFSIGWKSPNCHPRYVPLAICSQTDRRPPRLSDLAATLRLRLLKTLQGRVTSDQLSAISDEDIYWSYLTCCHCRRRLVESIPSLIPSIERFIDECDTLVAYHRCR